MSSFNLNTAKLFDERDVWIIYETARVTLSEERPIEDGDASVEDLIIALRESVEAHLSNSLEIRRKVRT